MNKSGRRPRSCTSEVLRAEKRSHLVRLVKKNLTNKNIGNNQGTSGGLSRQGGRTATLRYSRKELRLGEGEGRGDYSDLPGKEESPAAGKR